MNESYNRMYFVGQHVHFEFLGKEFVDVIKSVKRGDKYCTITTSNGLNIRSTQIISVIGESHATITRQVRPMSERVVDESVVDMPSYMFVELHNTLHGMNVENWHRIKLDEALATGNKELFDELTGESYV